MKTILSKSPLNALFDYARGESKQSIADSLNASNIAPKGNNKKWKPEDIDSYIASTHPISSEFAEILRYIRRLRGKKVIYPQLLTGKMVCKLCGAGFVTQTSGYKGYRKTYYVCYAKSKSTNDCESLRVNAEVLDARVWVHIDSVLKYLKKLPKNSFINSEIAELSKGIKQDSPFVWRYALTQLLIESVTVRPKKANDKFIPEINIKMRVKLD